jgi:hypothetical protein
MRRPCRSPSHHARFAACVAAAILLPGCTAEYEAILLSEVMVPSPPALSANQCRRIQAAREDLGRQMLVIIQLDNDEDYALATSPDTMPLFQLDVARFREDLDAIAELPDVDAAGFPPISQVVPRFREIADLLEANLRAGRPFSGADQGGQRLKEAAHALVVEGQAAISATCDAVGCKPVQ